MISDIREIWNNCVPYKPQQLKGEFCALLKWLQNNDVEIKNFLEIGIGSGGSLLAWLQIAKPGVWIAVDKEIATEIKGIVEQYPVHLIEGNSSDKSVVGKVGELLDKQLLDFLFIDGSHSFRNVFLDYKNYRPLVKTGGYIVFHDISSKGVSELWGIIKGRKVEFVIDPNNEWYGIGLTQKQCT